MSRNATVEPSPITITNAHIKRHKPAWQSRKAQRRRRRVHVRRKSHTQHHEEEGLKVGRCVCVCARIRGYRYPFFTWARSGCGEREERREPFWFYQNRQQQTTGYRLPGSPSPRPREYRCTPSINRTPSFPTTVLIPCASHISLKKSTASSSVSTVCELIQKTSSHQYSTTSICLPLTKHSTNATKQEYLGGTC